MKAYRIVFEADALEEAGRAMDYIALQSALRAMEWYHGLQDAIASLAAMPTRCGLARENKDVGEPLRQYIYHSHRIIFQVDEPLGIVRILHIRHAAMKPLDGVDDDEL